MIKLTRHGYADRRFYGLGKPSAVAARASDPDFVPSLRLLMEQQEYSATDVGMMFGVSRERVRQWCAKYSIEQRGLYRGENTRCWNDATNRFEPSSAGSRYAKRLEANRNARRAWREQRRLSIVRRLKELESELGRIPTNREMALHLSGRLMEHHQAAPWLCGYWGNLHRNNTRGAMGAIRTACGWPAVKVGRPRR